MPLKRKNADVDKHPFSVHQKARPE